jgi:FkbM family methyltransferase
MSLRQTIVRTADRAGLGAAARRAHAAVQPWHRKQNARDDRNLALLLQLTLSRDAVCVDVGANVGTVLAEMVAAAPDGKHTAFEPVPWLAADLRARFPQVTVHASAVSDRPGEASFTVLPDRPAQSSLSATRSPGTGHLPAQVITVPVVRLDDALTEPPAVVKIDVEGAELEALRGARQVLADAHPTVVLEFGHGNDPVDDERCEAVFAELDQAGMRIFDFDGAHLPWAAFREVYHTGSRWNFVAHR